MPTKLNNLGNPDTVQGNRSTYDDRIITGGLVQYPEDGHFAMSLQRSCWTDIWFVFIEHADGRDTHHRPLSQSNRLPYAHWEMTMYPSPPLKFGLLAGLSPTL